MLIEDFALLMGISGIVAGLLFWLAIMINF